jgi:hypothetical protein
MSTYNVGTSKAFNVLKLDLIAPNELLSLDFGLVSVLHIAETGLVIFLLYITLYFCRNDFVALR